MEQFRPRYYALLEYDSRIVLAINRFASSILFLEEATTGSMAISNVQYPNYPSGIPIDTAKTESLVEWTWTDARTFKKTPAASLSENIRKKSALAVAKMRHYKKVATVLSFARIGTTENISHQSAVYMTKKIQAQRFKDSGYDESIVSQLPYVHQFADYANLSLKTAADEILFKARLEDERLAKTELMRLIYTNKIKNAETPEELSDIEKNFFLDVDGNARLN